MKTENVVVDKSKAFAVRVVRLYQFLCDEKKEYVLSKQVLRSGTSIGANVKEAVRGQSKVDFIHKMNISLKEASETEYWLELLIDSGYYDDCEILEQCIEVKKLLISSINTAKNNTK